MVTWNPQLMEVKAEPDATEVFDSSKIPGEIEDLMVVNTETLKDNPDLGKALVGIWYETIALMQADTGEKGKAAREAMAKLSGTDLAGFEAQLKTTKHVLHAGRRARLHHRRRPAQDHGPGPHVLASSTICSATSVKSKDAIGIAMPDGSARRRDRTSSCASTRPT